MQRSWIAKYAMLGTLALGANLTWAADYFPLQPGNSWTYRDRVTGSEFTVRVSGVAERSSTKYFYLEGYTPATEWVRINEFGNLAYWDDELERERLLTSFEVVPGAWFEAPARMCPQEGQVGEKRTTHIGPAGTLEALEITYRVSACADAGTVSEQYAANIGMVRRVENTIAGPRTYDLVRATVGNQVISSGRTGSFSVSARDGREPGTWDADLRLTVPPDQPVTLKFNSGQEFDAHLRDASGRIVWTWSSTRLFIAALHEVKVNGEWTAQINVPHPPSIPEGRKEYQLEVYLTTAPGEPQFAAVTTVVVQGLEANGTKLERNATARR